MRSPCISPPFQCYIVLDGCAREGLPGAGNVNVSALEYLCEVDAKRMEKVFKDTTSIASCATHMVLASPSKRN